MAKITFIGAGSTVFAKNLMGDILSYPELANSTLTLFDIDQERLRTSEVVARNLARTLEVNPTIESTTDRRRALDGADYAICMIQVGGYKPGTVVDFEIPKKYGLRQTIADTLGVSRATVSNAFSRPDQLSADLRALILSTARELNYPGPNPIARSLRRYFPHYDAARVQRTYLELWQEAAVWYMNVRPLFRRRPLGLATDEAVAYYLQNVDWSRLTPVRTTLPDSAVALLIEGRARRRAGRVYDRIECGWGDLFLLGGLPAFFRPSY